MRIVVNDIAASKTGALSILKDFYNYILEHDKENEWIFILGDELLQEKDNIKILVRKDVKASWKNRLKFDLLTGAEYLKELKPDVVFSLQNTMPRGYKGRQVLYVHQPLGFQKWKRFSFFKAYEREYAIYQNIIGRMIDMSVKHADRVIVQTEWMREAVIKKTGISSGKITKIMPDVIIPEGYSSKPVAKNNKFFFPAGNILYKNHGCIIEAAKLLVNDGITDFSVSFTLEENEAVFLSEYEKLEQIRYLGKVDRNEVFRKYTEEILVFPSYIETFGYPPTEARAVGGMILASDCPFCHEALDGYDRAYYFNPFSAKELYELMKRAINGELNSTVCIEDEKLRLCPNESWGAVIKEITGVFRNE